MSVIKAGTTVTTALVLEGNTDGDLIFKTGSAAVTAMSISASGVVTFPATTGFDIASANITNLTSGTTSATVLRSASATITNLLAGYLNVSGASYLASASGNVGIGTTTPNEKLQVNGAIRANGPVAANSTGTIIAYDSNNSVLGAWGPDNSTRGTTVFYRAYANGGGGTESARITSDGNFGLGVTPVAWGSGCPAFQFGDSSAIWTRNSDNLSVWTANSYFNGTNDKYIESAAASRIYQLNGAFNFENASSGTAGNNLTFTTRVVISASGNVGIGTSSPDAVLHVAAAADGADVVYASTNSSNAIMILRPDGVNGSVIRYGGNGAGADTLRFVGVGNTERARFNSTGAFVLAGGTTTADGIGITFPATQSASSNANTLDDYEEGQWTPTFLVAGSETGVTYNVRYGFYTKVGNIITIWGGVTLTNNGSGTGEVTIGGMPFAAGPISSYQHPGQASVVIVEKANDYVWGMAVDSGSKLFFRRLDVANADTTATDADFDNNTAILFTVVYKQN